QRNYIDAAEQAGSVKPLLRIQNGFGVEGRRWIKVAVAVNDFVCRPPVSSDQNVSDRVRLAFTNAESHGKTIVRDNPFAVGLDSYIGKTLVVIQGGDGIPSVVNQDRSVYIPLFQPGFLQNFLGRYIGVALEGKRFDRKLLSFDDDDLNI